MGIYLPFLQYFAFLDVSPNRRFLRERVVLSTSVSLIVDGLDVGYKMVGLIIIIGVAFLVSYWRQSRFNNRSQLGWKRLFVMSKKRGRPAYEMVTAELAEARKLVAEVSPLKKIKTASNWVDGFRFRIPPREPESVYQDYGKPHATIDGTCASPIGFCRTDG